MLDTHKNNEPRKEDKGSGMQGIDKAPGEETASSTEQFISQSQKGKKVDADLSDPSDQPIDRQELD
ncbi:MAG: hypothetical protein H0U44_01675 [Flavisolibacter sp.]|jgi:hypothetical protein|nr:hypothetical protein [Flavisolibacter sp.]